MRQAVIALAIFAARLALTIALLLCAYAAFSLIRLFIESRGRVVAPDTGFLLGILMNFGTAALINFGVGTQVGKAPAGKIALPVLFMAAVYGFVTVMVAQDGLNQPFYGIIPTVGHFVILMSIEILGFLGLATASWLISIQHE